jgi:hypothetical protein
MATFTRTNNNAVIIDSNDRQKNKKDAANKGYTPGGLLSIYGLSYFYRTFDAVWANSAWYSARRIALPVICDFKNPNKTTIRQNKLTFMFHFRETIVYLYCGQKSET